MSAKSELSKLIEDAGRVMRAAESVARDDMNRVEAALHALRVAAGGITEPENAPAEPKEQAKPKEQAAPKSASKAKG